MNKEKPVGREPNDRIDLDGLDQKYRDLKKLRQMGLAEVRFAHDNPAHMDRYKDLIPELKFESVEYHEVSLQGINFVFLPENRLDFFGLKNEAPVSNRRSRLKAVVDGDPEDFDDA